MTTKQITKTIHTITTDIETLTKCRDYVFSLDTDWDEWDDPLEFQLETMWKKVCEVEGIELSPTQPNILMGSGHNKETYELMVKDENGEVSEWEFITLWDYY